jgi:outer membrane protein insertion porin family
LPITDNFGASVGYNLVQEKYKLDMGRLQAGEDRNDPKVLEQYWAPALIEASKQSPWLRSSISYALTYNSIDDQNNPHDGIYARFGQEFAGLGGDAKFIKTTAKASYYKTLLQEADVVGVLTAGGGYVHKLTDDGLRIFDMFKGNTDMIRGFKYNGIGPYQDATNGDRYWLGGTTYFHASAEVQFPMPVIPESLGIRGAFFADAATLYGNKTEGSASNPIYGTGSSLRASAGVSLMWASPFGPLRFDYAIPLKKEDSDKVQNFNFGMSSKF